MEAQPIYLLANFITVLILATQGMSDCDLNSLTIGTIRSDKTIQGETEWNVIVINNCKCPIGNLVLSCKGFSTVGRLDQSKFKQIGDDKCLVNGGNPIAPRDSVKFSYAWDPPVYLFPVSLDGSCS
ncbi:TPD1 protein homolog 1B [Linum grandiflorum]